MANSNINNQSLLKTMRIIYFISSGQLEYEILFTIDREGGFQRLNVNYK